MKMTKDKSFDECLHFAVYLDAFPSYQSKTRYHQCVLS